MIDHTHSAEASSWVDGADDDLDFPVQNLPLGIISHEGGPRRVATAIGRFALDLTAIAALMPVDIRSALREPTLNALFALPGATRVELRHALFELLTQKDRRPLVTPHLHGLDSIRLHLPFEIGDYSDFYVGIHHATNIGKLFRPDDPLLPNYKHLPIGYHGRASSVRVSGAAVVRPRGQVKATPSSRPEHGPTTRLDYELELGLWIAGEQDLGETIPIERAWDRIGGICLLNDWSARDMQAWEYQPLGPFLAKSFLTSVSPWVVTSQALEPFRAAPHLRAASDPPLLPYLQSDEDARQGALSITVEARIATAAMRDAGLAPHRLSSGDVGDAMYWTAAQMVAHHASGGCNLRPGDLLGTGTLSTSHPSGFGSLIELTTGGTAPVLLPGGESRTFLADGDEVILSARAEHAGFRSIGLGSCRGVVEPAR